MRLDIGVPGVADMKCVTLWLFDGRLALNAHYLPQHGWKLKAWNNGGRKAEETFDTTLWIGPIHLGLTLWRIGAWSHLLRFLPDNDEMRRDISDWGL